MLLYWRTSMSGRFFMTQLATWKLRFLMNARDILPTLGTHLL